MVMHLLNGAMRLKIITILMEAQVLLDGDYIMILQNDILELHLGNLKQGLMKKKQH
jgi:hypothetical protein